MGKITQKNKSAKEGENMIQLILSSLLIPLVVILAISMLILASPLIIGGLIYLNYQINRREKV